MGLAFNNVRIHHEWSPDSVPMNARCGAEVFGMFALYFREYTSFVKVAEMAHENSAGVW